MVQRPREFVRIDAQALAPSFMSIDRLPTLRACRLARDWRVMMMPQANRVRSIGEAGDALGGSSRAARGDALLDDAPRSPSRRGLPAGIQVGRCKLFTLPTFPALKVSPAQPLDG
jgi:hypothetical protein